MPPSGVDDRKVVVLDVAEFEDTPIICTNTISSSVGQPRTILREAAVYVRTAAATTEEVKAPDEMRSLIGRATARRRDLLLRDIQSLLTGKALLTPESVRERYASEVQATEKFLEEKLARNYRGMDTSK